MGVLQRDDFVELERTFHDLRIDAQAGDDGEMQRVLFRNDAVDWRQLLAEYRVVLLAEAGAGKTQEIRAAATRLRSAGSLAFFLRIEHIAASLEDAFEIGDAGEFAAWLGSADEGWLLLDSVDEARLRSPKDFEAAMRVLSRRIKSAMPRAHIVITGRTTAWRPKTDLQLCAALFPFERPQRSRSTTEADQVVIEHGDDGESPTKPFRIVALCDLGQEQIKRFLLARGVENVENFLESVERADAWTFTARPQDLEELAQFWIAESRIGSQLEIMRSSIERRLTKRDQDRAEYRPLSVIQARQGARLARSSSRRPRAAQTTPTSAAGTARVSARSFCSASSRDGTVTTIRPPARSFSASVATTTDLPAPIGSEMTGFSPSCTDASTAETASAW